MTRKQKRKWGDWHHRVPDFELVYCGPKKNLQTKEEKPDKNFKKTKQIEKALQ